MTGLLASMHVIFLLLGNFSIFGIILNYVYDILVCNISCLGFGVCLLVSKLIWEIRASTVAVWKKVVGIVIYYDVSFLINF